MKGPETFLYGWMGYWAFLSNQSTAKWFNATRDIRRRSYSPTNAYSDMLDYWTDATLGWWSALGGSLVDTPTVLFTLDLKDQSDRKHIGPFFPPSLPLGEPRVLWLGRVSERPKNATGKEIEAKSCKASWSKDRTTLEIRLVGLVSQKEKLEPGTYHAIVHVSDHPLADVYVDVEAPDSDKKKDAEGELDDADEEK